MSRRDPRLSGLQASVPPFAAFWLASRIPEMERAAEWFERQHQPGKGHELRVAVEQLRMAAKQVKVRDGVPRIGSAEAVESEMGAGSEVVDSPGTMTAAEAAGMLGLKSSRQVINLIRLQDLAAVQRGRGCTWEIDRQSVMNLLATRRLA